MYRLILLLLLSSLCWLEHPSPGRGEVHHHKAIPNVLILLPKHLTPVLPQYATLWLCFPGTISASVCLWRSGLASCIFWIASAIKLQFQTLALNIHQSPNYKTINSTFFLKNVHPEIGLAAHIHIQEAREGRMPPSLKMWVWSLNPYDRGEPTSESCSLIPTCIHTQ